MKENEIPISYSLKYGGIEEVLAGEGEPVENYVDLYGASKRDLILIPKVVGVHQNFDIENFYQTEEIYNQLAQRRIELKFRAEDEVHGSLISLVYDPEVFDASILRSLISGRDVLKRLNFSSYESVPDFKQKPVVSIERVTKLQSEVQNKKTRNKSLNLLERELEYFKINRDIYGLTRPEALNFESLKDILEQLKRKDRDKDSLSTSPTYPRILNSLRDIARRLLEEEH